MFYKVSEMKKLLKKYHDYTSEELSAMSEKQIQATFLQRRDKMLDAIHETNPVVHRKSELKQLEYVELLGLYTSLFPKLVPEKEATLLTMEDVKDIYAEELACLTEEEFEHFLRKNNIRIVPSEQVYTEAELEAMYPGIVSESSEESLLYFLSTNNIRMLNDDMTVARLKSYLGLQDSPASDEETPEEEPGLKFKP